MLWLLINGQTLYITILLAGLFSLRICNSWLFIVMKGCEYIKLSKICLLGKNMQNRLFEILDTNVIFLRETIYQLLTHNLFVGCRQWN